MNKPRTDIIDITKIRRPVLAWWDSPGGLELEIYYPLKNNQTFTAYAYEADFEGWRGFNSNQASFEFRLVAWQYI